MWDIRVCVGCLATDVRMYCMRGNGLLQPYQRLAGVKTDDTDFDEMPDKLCWECAALVNKFNTFRRKCERAHLLLRDIYTQHQEISCELVQTLDRKRHDLCSTLSVFVNIDRSASCTSETTTSNKRQARKQLKSKTTCSRRKSLSQSETIDNTETTEKSGKHQTQAVGFVKVEVEPLVKVEVDIKKEDSKDNIDVKSENDYSDVPDAEIFTAQVVNPAVVFAKKRKLEKTKIQKKEATKVYKRKGRIKDKKRAQDYGMKVEFLTQEQMLAVMLDRQKADGYYTARYRCEFCYKPFNGERQFNNHSIRHDPVSGPLVCDVCKFRFKSRNPLNKHITTHHMRKYTCTTCDAVFRNITSAQKHFDWHEGVTYSCDICGATFRKRTSRLNHMRIKHTSSHVCPDCGEMFVSIKGLDQHSFRIHSLKRDSGSSETAPGPYCSVCDVQFTCQQAWTRHILISPKHEHEKSLAALGCDFCGETLDDKECLRAHRAAHRRSLTREPDDAAISVCDICGLLLKGTASLNDHRARHSGVKEHGCPSCPKRFYSALHMRMHQAIHSEVRPHVCTICGKNFKWKSALLDHARVHTGEKPYSCSVCGKTFSSYTSRTKHEIKAHGKDRRRRGRHDGILHRL